MQKAKKGVPNSPGVGIGVQLDPTTLADLGEGTGGCNPPPFWLENFTQKIVIFGNFRAAPPFPYRMVDKSNHERLQPRLSKISRSAYATCI